MNAVVQKPASHRDKLSGVACLRTSPTREGGMATNFPRWRVVLVNSGFRQIELNALGQRQCAAAVDGAGLATHVGFPSV